MPRARRAVARHLIRAQKHQVAAAALTKRSAKLANRAKVRQFAANLTQRAALAKVAAPGAKRSRARARFRLR